MSDDQARYITARLSTEDEALVQHLTERLGVGRSEIVRRGLHELARQVRITARWSGDGEDVEALELEVHDVEV